MRCYELRILMSLPWPTQTQFISQAVSIQLRPGLGIATELHFTEVAKEIASLILA